MQYDHGFKDCFKTLIGDADGPKAPKTLLGAGQTTGKKMVSGNGSFKKKSAELFICFLLIFIVVLLRQGA